MRMSPECSRYSFSERINVISKNLRARMLGSPFASCVTLGKSHNRSESWLLICKMGMIIATHQICDEEQISDCWI